eukprot:11559009-Alexandrium_andersonii.AAC.1
MLKYDQRGTTLATEKGKATSASCHSASEWLGASAGRSHSHLQAFLLLPHRRTPPGSHAELPGLAPGGH